MSETSPAIAIASAPAATKLGPFQVSAGRAEVDAFCRETGWQEASCSGVPVTFPMRWLSSSALRAGIEAELAKVGGAVFHESQSFAYEGRLEVDRDYLLSAEIESQADPARLILRVVVGASADAPLLRVETILRIVGAPGSPS